MAFKTLLILLATLLVVTTTVSSNGEEKYCAPAPSPKPNAPIPSVGPPAYAPLHPWTPPNECTKVCLERCNTGKGKKECERACASCCKVCKCVPPGPRGTNLEKCGSCYTKVTYRNQISVCP